MRLLHCASFLEQQWWMNESKSFVQIKRSIFPSSHTTAANVIGEIFAPSLTLHIPSSFIRWTESGSRYSGRDGSGRKRSRHKVLTKRHTVIQTMLCPSLTSCWSIRNISRINSGGRLHCCFLVSSWSISWIFLGRINPRSLEVDFVKVDIYSRCWKKARKNGRIMALRSPGSITPRGEEKGGPPNTPKECSTAFLFQFLTPYVSIHSLPLYHASTERISFSGSTIPSNWSLWGQFHHILYNEGGEGEEKERGKQRKLSEAEVWSYHPLRYNPPFSWYSSWLIHQSNINISFQEEQWSKYCSRCKPDWKMTKRSRYLHGDMWRQSLEFIVNSLLHSRKQGFTSTEHHLPHFFDQPVIHHLCGGELRRMIGWGKREREEDSQISEDDRTSRLVIDRANCREEFPNPRVIHPMKGCSSEHRKSFDEGQQIPIQWIQVWKMLQELFNSKRMRMRRLKCFGQ